MNQARSPSRGTRQGSLLWSLWPYCMSTSSTTVCSFREGKEGIFLILYAAGEFGWALPHSFISISCSCSVPHPPTPHPQLHPTAAARWPVVYTICQVWQCQSGDTSWVVSTCPCCCCMGGPDQMALLEETEVPYLYLAGVGTFHVSDHEMCD